MTPTPNARVRVWPCRTGQPDVPASGFLDLPGYDPDSIVESCLRVQGPSGPTALVLQDDFAGIGSDPAEYIHRYTRLRIMTPSGIRYILPFATGFLAPDYGPITACCKIQVTFADLPGPWAYVNGTYVLVVGAGGIECWFYDSHSKSPYRFSLILYRDRFRGRWRLGLYSYNAHKTYYWLGPNTYVVGNMRGMPDGDDWDAMPGNNADGNGTTYIDVRGGECQWWDSV